MLPGETVDGSGIGFRKPERKSNWGALSESARPLFFLGELPGHHYEFGLTFCGLITQRMLNSDADKVPSVFIPPSLEHRARQHPDPRIGAFGTDVFAGENRNLVDDCVYLPSDVCEFNRDPTRLGIVDITNDSNLQLR